MTKTSSNEINDNVLMFCFVCLGFFYKKTCFTQIRCHTTTKRRYTSVNGFVHERCLITNVAALNL